ncbi:MAG: adenylate/guanylate cyclase domain-containing protein, partial [Dehalococcoidia bacterium]
LTIEVKMKPPEWFVHPPHTLSPDDLTDEEVARILDPGSTGVPELSPVRALPETLRRLEREAAQATGEERLVLRAERSFGLMRTDPAAGREQAQLILAEAEESAFLLAQAIALEALVHAGFGDDDMETTTSLLSRAIEICAHLELDLRLSRLLTVRATLELARQGNPRQAVSTVWRARELAISGEGPDTLRHDTLGGIFQLMGRISYTTERDRDVSQRYAALAVLHYRNSITPGSVANLHNGMGFVASDHGELDSAILHFERAALIHDHHQEVWLGLRAIGQMTHGQIENDDISGAQASVARMQKRIEGRQHRIQDEQTVKMLQGRIAVRTHEWDTALRLLIPALDDGQLSAEMKVKLLTEVSIALEQQGKSQEALGYLKQAMQQHIKLGKGIVKGRTSRFVLSDEIRRLKAQHGVTRETVERQENLLRAILPPSAYEELSRTGACEARYYEHVAIFYSDFAGFTAIASGMPPAQLFQVLGELFDAFDDRMAAHGCERVETIGDAYLAVCGLGAMASPMVSADPPEVRLVRAALEIKHYLQRRNAEYRAIGSPEFHARIGVQAGPVVGGLVGSGRLRFAIFGDAVNTSQRLESGGVAGQVTVSADIAPILAQAEGLALYERAPISAKGKGMLSAFEVRSTDRRRHGTCV